MLEKIKADIASVMERDPAARNWFEVVTTYPGIHALLMHRFSHALWNIGLKWLARVFSNVARLLTGIEIHPGATIGERFFIDHGMGVVIGETAEIGNDCTLYHGVTLGGTSWNPGKRHPTLGDNVVIGAGAKVLGPITVHNNARIGSNAVVVKDVPAGATMVGIPGRQVNRPDMSDKREKMAEKMGFDAYGATSDMPDPVANTLNKVLDHIHKMDDRMDKMCIQIKHMDKDFNFEPIPELDAESFLEADSPKPSNNKDNDCENT